MVLDAVARGLGFTVVSRLVLETSPWQRQVRELSLPHPVQETMYLVTRRGMRMPRRYTRLLEAFREHRHHERYGHGDPALADLGEVTGDDHGERLG
jgi:DNA-binding transcriptional LysR family regulator